MFWFGMVTDKGSVEDRDFDFFWDLPKMFLLSSFSFLSGKQLEGL